MSEHLADLLVLPRGELLEHVELVGDEPHAAKRPAEHPRRFGDLALLGQPRRLLDVARRELQPQLRGLVDDLEEQLVAVDALVGRLLELEQLDRVHVALVVGRRVAGKDRSVVVLARL